MTVSSVPDDVSGGNPTVRRFQLVIDELAGAVVALDVSSFDEGDLRAVLNHTRGLQRRLDGLTMRVGVRANQLAASGDGVPAGEAMRGRGTVGAQQARRESARATAAEQISGLGDAASEGETTGAHVDSIARHTTKLTDKQRANFDFDDLVERAKHMLPEAFDRYVKRQVDNTIADHGLNDTKTKQAASEFRHWIDQHTGMGRITGTLDPERYELLTNAIEHHMTTIAAASPEPVNKTKNLAAEALIQLATGAANESGRRQGSGLPSILVVVDHQTITTGPHEHSIRQTEAGHDLAPETISRLCCDATIRRVTLDQTGIPINVGRKYRTATDAQWAAIKAIHTTCAWHACTAPINWCQAHHIHEWEHDGQTDLENLVPLCSQHHHRVHEGQWTIKLLPDRTLKIHKPNGTHHTTTPTPQRC